MGNFLYNLTLVLKQPLKLVYPIKVIGPRSIPNKKSIIVMNHLSGWDPIMWSIWFRTRAHFLYKSVFDKNAILKFFLRRLEHISVRRGEVDITAIKSCIELLNQDKILALYPEGTRNKQVDCLDEFKTGTALLALKTHAPLRAVYIYDRCKPFRKNYIIVGDEFTLEEYYDQEITKQVLLDVMEKIRNNMDDLRIKLNDILAKKGIKRRKRTKKEIREYEKYMSARREKMAKREKLRADLAKRLAEPSTAEQLDSDTATTAEQLDKQD